MRVDREIAILGQDEWRQSEADDGDELLHCGDLDARHWQAGRQNTLDHNGCLVLRFDKSWESTYCPDVAVSFLSSGALRLPRNSTALDCLVLVDHSEASSFAC